MLEDPKAVCTFGEAHSRYLITCPTVKYWHLRVAEWNVFSNRHQCRHKSSNWHSKIRQNYYDCSWAGKSYRCWRSSELSVFPHASMTQRPIALRHKTSGHLISKLRILSETKKRKFLIFIFKQLLPPWYWGASTWVLIMATQSVQAWLSTFPTEAFPFWKINLCRGRNLVFRPPDSLMRGVESYSCLANTLLFAQIHTPPPGETFPFQRDPWPHCSSPAPGRGNHKNPADP